MKLKSIGDVKARLSSFVHDTAQLSPKVHALVFTVALLASSQVMAAGVSGFLAGWSTMFKNAISLTLLAGMAIGIGATLYGLVNLVKKGMGRDDDIRIGAIIWPIVGGALATIVLYVIQSVVEEGGASRSDMGRQQN